MSPNSEKLPFCFQRVIFDLDGTLVDSGPDLAAAMNHVLGLHGRPTLPLEEVRHMVGQGAAKLIERGLAATGGGNDADVQRYLPEFIDYYAAHIADATRLFDGAHAVLDELADNHVAMAICTNKPQKLAEKLIEALGLASYFSCIAGGDLLDHRKPHRAHLDYVLDAMAGHGPAVMIGDTITDLKSGRNSGLPTILVSFGFSPTPVRSLGAELVIDDFAQVPPALRDAHGPLFAGAVPGGSGGAKA